MQIVSLSCRYWSYAIKITTRLIPQLPYDSARILRNHYLPTLSVYVEIGFQQRLDIGIYKIGFSPSISPCAGSYSLAIHIRNLPYVYSQAIVVVVVRRVTSYFLVIQGLDPWSIATDGKGPWSNNSAHTSFKLPKTKQLNGNPAKINHGTNILLINNSSIEWYLDS